MFIYFLMLDTAVGWMNHRLLVLAQDWWDTGWNLYSAQKFNGQFISLGLPYLLYPSLSWRKLQLVCLQTPTQVFYHLYESIWRKKRGKKIVSESSWRLRGSYRFQWSISHFIGHEENRSLPYNVDSRTDESHGHPDVKLLKKTITQEYKS